MRRNSAGGQTGDTLYSTNLILSALLYKPVNLVTLSMADYIGIFVLQNDSEKIFT